MEQFDRLTEWLKMVLKDMKNKGMVQGEPPFLALVMFQTVRVGNFSLGM